MWFAERDPGAGSREAEADLALSQLWSRLPCFLRRSLLLRLPCFAAFALFVVVLSVPATFAVYSGPLGQPKLPVLAVVSLYLILGIGVDAILINVAGVLALVYAFCYAAWFQEGIGAAIQERLSFVGGDSPNEPEKDSRGNVRDTDRDANSLDSAVAIEMAEFGTSGVPVMGSVTQQGELPAGECTTSVAASPEKQKPVIVEEQKAAVAEKVDADSESMAGVETAPAEGMHTRAHATPPPKPYRSLVLRSP